MGTHLDRIMARTALRVAERKAAADINALEREAAGRTCRGFVDGLRRVGATRPAVIAELKKASPSKGLIRPSFDPVELARGLEASGAAALSVLTDEDFFQGSLGYLRAASSVVSIPVLRKDFIFDPFQVLEAKAAGADAILLIVAALEDQALRGLKAEAEQWGLDVLCEAHDRKEIKRAVGLGFGCIGVNSRNLKTLEVSATTLEELVEYLPAEALRVAESGIRGAEDMARLRGAGYQALLVGEALMREEEAGGALARLLGRGA